MRDLPSSIAVLGSTGSVGTQALDVAREHGIPVTLLTAHRQVDLMEQQVREFSPRYCAMADPRAAEQLKIRLADTPVTVLSGEEGVLRGIALSGAETVVNAILGMAGLKPTLAALQTGARLALSNKESLVIAGHIVREEARKNGAEILPVDSEHSAIFQCLLAGRREEVKGIILTASGGPFRGYTRAQLETVTLSQTLNHPTWKMGAKITVDSATLANKGFELIEACHLFDLTPDQIRVVVHPQSMIHSAVEYTDGTVIAQMSPPDMKGPIRYALTYPARIPCQHTPLDLFSLGQMTFFPPDCETFPLLALAGEAFRLGGGVPACLNAANEVAVAAFLAERISFITISDVVSETVARMHHAKDVFDLAGILDADRQAREVANQLVKLHGKSR